MKKLIQIELRGEWVFRHRNDDELPITRIKKELLKLSGFEIKSSSFTMLTVTYDNEKLGKEETESKITEIFSSLFSGENAKEILTLSFQPDAHADNKDGKVAEADGEKTADKSSAHGKDGESTSDKDGKAADSDDKDDDGEVESAEDRERRIEEIRRALEERRQRLLRRMEDKQKESGKKEGDGPDGGKKEALEKITNLVGVEEFKELAREIVKIAPEIISKKTQEVFFNQCYLFSIGDGYGLTTYLNLLAQLLTDVGLISPDFQVYEVKAGPYKDSMDPFSEVMPVLRSGNPKRIKILCVDVSEWITKSQTSYFKQFLRQVEKANDNFVVVFRVPFVEKDVLADLKYSLDDLLSVRMVSFPPLNHDEIRVIAENEIKRYGFTVAKGSWEFFDKRIMEEKSDGKFYGHNTVKKVVKELVYSKQLKNAGRKKPSDVISNGDMKAICRAAGDDALSATEQLSRMVGNEKVKAQIEEIIAQIELAIKENSSDRPCIHMRFVGNPGTGKTTVARIIGKMLKERGVLRIGNFFEYGGRDFCGRYIGETAPKTSSICRDAYGSVLFIDEAYSLYRGDDTRDFGKEAIDTLIAEMENHRSDFVVIMAGYTDDMEKLMEGNKGLKSRMPYTIDFPNFTREQLYEIYASLVTSKFKYEPEILEAARSYFADFPEEILSSKDFSNGRFVRNLYERTWAKAAMRSQLDKKGEIVLTKDDFERASGEKDFSQNVKKKSIIGF